MSKVYISLNANLILEKYLKERGHDVIKVEATDMVYDGVSSHPDIYMCKLGADPSSSVFFGQMENIGFKYPENICYNGVVMGKYFIHNLKYTAPDLQDELMGGCEEGYINVNVRQGYTKCNMVVVDAKHAITADKGIIKALTEKDENDRPRTDLQILEVSPGQVLLDGFPYGFLGGASGRVDDEIIFNGDLSKHSDFEPICRFIEETGLTVKYFEEYPLKDIGSIIQKL